MVVMRFADPTSIHYAAHMRPIDNTELQRKDRVDTPTRPLIDYYEPQEHGAYCGIASAAIVMNYATQSKRFTQQDIAQYVYSSSWNSGQGARYGLSLDQVGDIISHYGIQCTVYHVQPEQLSHYYDVLLRALQPASNPNTGTRTAVIGNYWRQFDGWRGGHFSPFNGSRCVEDRGQLSDAMERDGSQERVVETMVLDTQPKRAPIHWIPLTSLISMMSRADSTSKQTRGFIVVEYTPS